MVISIMKKYLFLLLLLIIYLMLISFPKTAKVTYYDNKKNSSIVTVMLNYENGINSKDLEKLFENYSKEYYVTKLKVNKKELDVSCSNITSCIDNVYKLSDPDFETNYIATGFKINKIYFLAYKQEIEKYLKAKDVTYETW